MNLSVMEQAIADWILAVTQLPVDKVYFTHQGQRTPTSGNRVSITIGDIPTQGLPETIKTIDETQPRGKEISQEKISMATMNVQLQAYGLAVVGTTGPRQMLSDVRASLGLDGVRAKLHTAGLGPNITGTVRWVPAIAGANFEARAVLDLLFSCSESALEQIGYFQTIKARGHVNGQDLGVKTFQLSNDRVALISGLLEAPACEIDVERGPLIFLDVGATQPLTHDDPQVFSFSLAALDVDPDRPSWWFDGTIGDQVFVGEEYEVNWAHTDGLGGNELFSVKFQGALLPVDGRIVGELTWSDQHAPGLGLCGVGTYRFSLISAYRGFLWSLDFEITA